MWTFVTLTAILAPKMEEATSKAIMEHSNNGYVNFLEYNDRMSLRHLMSEEESTGDESEHEESTASLDIMNETFYEHNSVEHYMDELIENYEHIENDTVDCHFVNESIEILESLTSGYETFFTNKCEIEHEEHEEHELVWGVYLILYTAFVLFLGCLFKWISSRLHLPIPYTVLLLALGVAFESWEYSHPETWGDLASGFGRVRQIDPHMILHLFIPGLIFESAFNTNYHIFVKEREQALTLAGPGVFVNLLLTGGVMHYFAWTYGWSWSFCFMFGAIVSATDPVAVVALLKDLGASKRLSTLIEAESLLNDGTAYVMFAILQEYASTKTATFASVIENLLRLAGGGVLFGVLFGWVTYRSLLYVFNDFQTEITFTLAMCYLAFYTAEYAEVSGVLCVVFMGLWVSKNRQAISPLVEETMHHFWEMVGFIANTILFFVTGQVIAFKVLSAQGQYGWEDFVILLILYVFCHINRALSIWQLFPVLESTGYGCTWKDAIVMVYGGLRGAIGLALALIVDNENSFTEINRDRVLFHVSGIVFLTLVVNATTISLIVNKLELNKPPQDTAALFKSATDHLSDHIHHKLSAMKLDKHYQGANWTKVEDLQPKYNQLYEEIFGKLDEQEKQHVLEMTGDNSEDELKESTQQLNDGNNNNNNNNMRGSENIAHDLNDPRLLVNVIMDLDRAQREASEKREIEKRVIQVMKSSYWSQYEKGLISSDAVHVLVEAAESAMDEHNLERQYRVLKKYFSIPKYIQKMHTAKICCKKFWKGVAERLLFNNLGFAIELASGFIYASKQAHAFAMMLIHNEGVKDDHINAAIQQLHAVTDFISHNLTSVERLYPEVHQAIQTSHAAHALLHHQKHEIEKLLHQGVFDEAECSRVMDLCDEALNSLFHTGFGEYRKELDDLSALLQSPLFSELTEQEKLMVKNGAQQSKWFDKGSNVVEAGSRSKGIFVITRGSVAVYEVTNDIERKRTLSAQKQQNGGEIGGFGGPLYTKQRGECLDIFPILQEKKHSHSFTVSSEKCHGFWLYFDLLHSLKEQNIDFWDTLWKSAAVDVIRYYYQDHKVFESVDLNNLENMVFESPLSYYNGDENMNEIKIPRGFGVLLNGSIVKIDDMSATAQAPAILTPAVSGEYIAVDHCVVLTLDVNRNRMINANVKLAHMFGLKGQGSKKRNIGTKADVDFEDWDESESLSSDTDDDEISTGVQKSKKAKSQPDAVHTISEDNIDEHESVPLTSAIGSTSNNVSLNQLNDDADSNKIPQTPTKMKHAQSDARTTVTRQATLDRFRSRTLLGKDGKKRSSRHGHHGHRHEHQPTYKFSYNLDDNNLPTNNATEWDTWTVEECFEVAKHILNKHEGLFEEVKKFHIRHISNEAKSRAAKKNRHGQDKDDGKDIEFSKSENLNDDDSVQHTGRSFVRPSDDGSNMTDTRENALSASSRSKWARPSMGPNGIMKAQTMLAGATIGSPIANKQRMNSLSKQHGNTKYRSSRFIQSQQYGNTAAQIIAHNNQAQFKQPAVISSKKYKKQQKALKKVPPPPPDGNENENKDNDVEIMMDDALSGIKKSSKASLDDNNSNNNETIQKSPSDVGLHGWVANNDTAPDLLPLETEMDQDPKDSGGGSEDM